MSEQAAKKQPGRPALPPGEKLVVVPVRLTEAQKAKLQRIGVQRPRLEALHSSVRRANCWCDVF